MSDSYTEDIAGEQERIQANIDELNEAIANITSVIMTGIVSVALTDKLAELEQKKAQIEVDMLKLEQRGNPDGKITVDPLLIPQEYTKLQNTPGSPAYKDFVQGFIDRIEVGRYRLTITIKTGLDVCPALDTVLTVRRQEVYERK